jgi:2-polyprenyl-6-hydroxyphenyl methylase/3-demethylubiquinone-9 3-methyltransferase
MSTYYETYWTAEGFQPTGGTFPELRDFIERTAQPGQRWLDVGCGDGRTSGLALTSAGTDYTGVDVSSTAVEQARALGLHAETITDAAVLPFEDGTFDGAVMIEVLEHLFAPHDAARELLRVLKPGGTLYATMPNAAYWRRRVELLCGRFDPIGDDLSVEQPWRDPHIRFFTPKTLRRMLTMAGFRDVRVGGHSGAWLADMPKVGHRLNGRHSALYGVAQGKAPSLLGKRLHVTARAAST